MKRYEKNTGWKMNNLNRFIEIIEDFKIVRDRTHFEITPDALFTNARALFISEQIAQQRGHNQIRQYPQAQGVQIEAPATDKNINYLRALGVNIPNSLTKKQAFLLIQKKTSENEA